MASRSTSKLALGLITLLGSHLALAIPYELNARTDDEPVPSLEISDLYDYQGCYSEPKRGRALDNVAYDDCMTVELCASLSGGSVYYGVEYGRECWYGNILHSGSTSQGDAKCTFACAGDADETCGDRMLLSLYRKSGAAMIAPKKEVGPYALQGCYVDQRDPRALKTLTGDDALTPEKCAEYCDGSTYMGLEYGRECWCADALDKSSFKAPDAQCQMPCVGDVGAMCGSPNRLDLYKIGSTPPPLPAFSSLGCYVDVGAVHRALPQLYADDLMTVELCASYAKSQGYAVFGVEYGRECWAGPTLDPAAYPSDGCTMPCQGDEEQTCGGSLRLNLYEFGGTPVASIGAAPTAV